MVGNTSLATMEGRRQLQPYEHIEVLAPIELRRSIRGPAWIGLFFVLLFLAGFGIWAGFAPLAGGAVAKGTISPDGSTKTVQHLEGGIIEQLLVRDGDRVKSGQTVLVMQSVQPRARHLSLMHQFRALTAQQLRLEAEQAGKQILMFPSSLMKTDAALRKVLDGQRELFTARLNVHSTRRKAVQKQIDQLRTQIRGYRAQFASAKQQLKLIAKEVRAKKFLLRRKITTQPQLLRLQRSEAEINGRLGEYSSLIAGAQQKIGEAKLKLLTFDAERNDNIATQLENFRVKLAETEEKLHASRDILKRTVITAPVAGTVVNLQFKTVGGIVKGGQPILDIVPAKDDLLIDARVSPMDIDIIKTGLPAQIHLSAYSSRTAPRINGIVKTISADALTDERTGQPYYTARIKVDRSELKRLAPKVELVPGMPADVLIVADERTMLEYLFQPFLDVMRNGLRET